MNRKRSSFSGKLGFVLSAAGASVGLGNIWRFPYLAAKYGGGIFLLVYIILALTFGYTMIVAETALGRMTKKSPVGAYESFGKSKWLSFGGWINAVIPILIAVIAGYVAAAITGILDFSAVMTAPIFALPNFSAPKFDLQAILIILPVILVITSEHIGHQVVTSKIVNRDLLKEPGLHRSLFGDNFSTMLSGLIGSVPTTTYGENIGVMAVTKVYSVQVIAGAAVFSIICSFIGKLSALIQTIPGPVIGGISFLLYGMIGTSGLRILVDSQVDYGKNRNQALTAVIFVTGLSGIKVNFGNVQLTGMVLACVTGMILSLVFYVFDKLKLTNDQ